MPIVAFIVLLTFLCYLIGSIPVGVMVGRARGFDPRAVGSGNVGMTNVARAGGGRAAAITFAGDLLKGLIPVMLGRAAGFAGPILALFGLAAFLGATYSLFLRFEGGKGVSASLGVWLGLAPSAVGIALVVFLIVFALGRIVSLASIIAVAVLPAAVAATGGGGWFLAAALATSAIVIFRHRSNIWRLMRGEEKPIRLGHSKEPPAG